VRRCEQQVAAALARVAQADRRAPAEISGLSGSIGLAALTLGALTNGTSVLSALAASA